jgi:arylsulfatase A-like enzyme
MIHEPLAMANSMPAFRHKQGHHGMTMNSNHRFTKTFLLGSIALLALNCQQLLAQSDVTRPNILIIFTDDQGYGDLACYGSQTNKTPRVDQLAKEGTRFTNFYAQHVCGPSRSALLTGRYPLRSKGWGMPADEVTFAELIRGSGYQTACIGKWDVSNRKAIIDRMPNAQGFDYYFGTLGANDGGGVKFHENNDPAGSTRDMGSLIDLYTDKAIDYLKNKRDPTRPFVLYVAHTMMHTIIDASPKFRGTSDGGLYGDVVEQFDFHTGRLLDTVDELGLRESTLVIYTTDNGPWNQPAYTNKKKGHPKGSIFWGDAGPLRDGKGSCYEAGSRAPCIVRWPGKVPENRVSDAVCATIDFMPTFATLAGYKVPADRIIDGVDQTDLIFGKSDDGARDTYFYQGNGVRQGKWKYLVAKHKVPGYARDTEREEVEELYDLESDIGETTNLADKHPQKVKELRALLREISEKK